MKDFTSGLKKSVCVTFALIMTNYFLYLYTIGRVSPEISYLFLVTFSLLIGGPLSLGLFFYIKDKLKGDKNGK